MIRVSKPSITELEKKYVNDALDCSDIGVGNYLGMFEDAWAGYNNRDYGVACNSGTNALFLALEALGIGEGDEVLVPEFTMIATAWAVTYTGATPVFVDCLDDLTADPHNARNLITKKTKAIIIVPIYGRPVSETIYNLAREWNIPIIEDMAEAHGIQPKGDISCYSFYGNKILTTGEGGMCLTNNLAWSLEIRSLANMYFDAKRTLIHPKIGHNFRLTNIQAAIGLAQVERIDELLRDRAKIASWYDTYLDERFLMPKREVVWVYDIDCGDKQQEIKDYLQECGIESRYGFKPMSRQPCYFNNSYSDLEAHKWSKRILYLPVYPGLSEADVKYVCGTLNAIKYEKR